MANKLVLTEKLQKRLKEELFELIESGTKAMRVVSLPLQGRSTILRSLFEGEKMLGWEVVVVDLPAIGELPSEDVLFAGKNKVLVVVNSIDTILKNIERFKKIMSWHYLFEERVCLMFGQGVEDIEEVRPELRELWPLLMNNTVWLGLFDRDYADSFWSSKNNGMKIDDESFELCGGYLPLMARLSELDKTKISVADGVVNFNLENLWECLAEGSQTQLMDLVRGKPKDFSDYLTKTGVVKNVDGKWKIFSPLFEEWLKNKLGESKSVLMEKEGKLWLNGTIDLENDLSFQEYSVLKELFDKKGETISRNQVAEILWPKDTEDKYSDWAIDQIMSKVRKKIGDIGEKKMIKTIKGQGFVFNQE